LSQLLSKVTVASCSV